MAKIYLDSGDNFTLSGAATVYGSTGTERLVVNSGVTGVVADANIERVDLSGASSAYTFLQTGTKLMVYSGTTLVATIPVQEDTDGSQVVFSNGSVSVKMTTTGTMTLGGATVSATTAGAVTPTTIDTATTSGSGTSTGTVTGQAFTLTSSSTPDIITGTTANDTITGAAGTMAATDVIVDSSTTDSDAFNLSFNSYASTTATITNVETFNVAGVYASTGFDFTNVTGTKTANFSTGLSGGTATVASAASTKVAAVVAGSNVGTLNVNTTAFTTGTNGNIDVNAGSATTIAVGSTGATGSDTFTLTVAANSSTTLFGGTGGTDAFTVNLPGGATTLLATNGVAATGDINTLKLNSNTAANTVTIGAAGATSVMTGAATGDGITVGGTFALTLKGDGDVLSGTVATDGVAITKSTGAGTVTFENTAALTSGFFNRANIDTLKLSGTATGVNLTVNENTTLQMTFANGSQTYNVGTNSTTGVIAAGAGTLKIDLAGTSASNATQTAIQTGTAVGTLVISNNTIDSTITALNTSATAGTTDTVVLTGSKALTITTWTPTAGEVMTAAGMTGTLSIGIIGVTGATVVGGSGNDTITGGTSADSISGGAGNDVLSGGTAAVADTMTGGSGNDTFYTVTATADVITDFSISGTNGVDIAALSIAIGAPVFSGASNATGGIASDGAGTLFTAGTAAKAVLVTAAKTFVAGEGYNVFVIGGGTFSSSATLEVAIESGGSRQLTLAAASAAADDIVVVWSDGTNGHIGTYNCSSAATTLAAAGAYTELLTLNGVTSVDSFASANVLFSA